MKTKTKWTGAVLSVAFLSLIMMVGVVHANPSYFAPQAKTALATTSPAYILPGTATSTVTYDSFNTDGTNESSGPQNPIAANSATLLVQFTASSTSSVLNVAIERSDDGIDWYQDNLSALATTTPAQNIGVPTSYTWTYATSTIGGVVNPTNRLGKSLFIQTPTRYTRAVFTAVGANSAVWAQFVPTKEAAE